MVLFSAGDLAVYQKAMDGLKRKGRGNHLMRIMLDSISAEYQRYKVVAERSLAQVSDDALNFIPMPDGNSLGMLVRHITGNIVSRFTDFLTTDGEKSWRNRNEEFAERLYTRNEVDEMWKQGWAVLEHALEQLSDDDLGRTVTIRGQEWTVHAALARSLSHLLYHVGQIVLLARMQTKQDWTWITIPKGESEQYNMNSTKERGPGNPA